MTKVQYIQEDHDQIKDSKFNHDHVVKEKHRDNNNIKNIHHISN